MGDLLDHSSSARPSEPEGVSRIRERELRELRTALLEGESVRLIASRESGRSHLLDQLAVEMESRGCTAIRVTGRRSFRTQQYVALREAGLVQLRGAQSESDIADELAHELAPVARPLLLIDDAEHLDLTSAYLLEQARSRRGIPAVVVAAPFVTLDEHGRTATAKIRTDSRLELPPLGYAQISLLAQQILGAPAQPEVLAQVLSMSSGLTGIAVAILRSAARENRIVQQDSGWTLAGGSLWNVHLRTTVEGLLGGLNSEELRALHALALAGSAVAESFQQLGPELVLGLTQDGLLTTFVDSRGIAHVAPRPSLISDYFENRPVDALHYDAVGFLRALEDPEARERALARAVQQQSRAESFDQTNNRGTGMTRFFETESAHLHAKYAREWRRNANAETAVAYLDALLGTEFYVAHAPRVFDGTEPGVSGPYLIRLGLHRLLWLTQAAPESAESSLREYVEAQTEPAAQSAFAAFEAYLVFSRYGMNPRVTEWWNTSASGRDGFTLAVRHFIGVISGQTTTALDAEVLDPAFKIQHFLVSIGNNVIRSRRAAPDRYERELRAEFEAAQQSFNYERLTVAAYFLAQQQAATFRDQLATETVRTTLAIGNPSLATAHYYVAQLRWAGYLHYLHGEPDLARSVLADTRRYPGIYGPLPAMQPAFGDAILLLIAGETDNAVELLLETSAVCREAKLGDASWSYAAMAFLERPTQAVFERLETVADLSAHGGEPLMRLVRAALDGDPELGNLAQRLTLDAEIATAISLLSAVMRGRRTQKELSKGAEIALLADTIQELRALLSIDGVPVNSGRVQALDTPELTKREAEVALLAASLQNREIAERLSLSVRTVENHLARAMKKLGLNARTELSTIAPTADRR